MPFLVEHSFALSRFMSDKWNDFEYLGDSVDTGLSYDVSDISIDKIKEVALTDLHPKLEKIQNRLKQQLIFIGLYNTRLKQNPNHPELIEFMTFLENSLEEIHEQTSIPFSI